MHFGASMMQELYLYICICYHLIMENVLNLLEIVANVIERAFSFVFNLIRQVCN